jgi:PKD repeat protein
MLSMVAIPMLGLTNLSESTPQALAVLAITAKTDQQTYLQRQKAIVSGNVTVGGSPATDFVVAVEVNNPPPYGHYSFRTIQVGNPAGPWLVNISSIYLQDMSNNPIDTIKAGSRMQVGMTVRNLQSTAATIFATSTVYDANMVALATNHWTSSIDPLQTVGSKFQTEVPSWATSGQAVIVCCVYSNEPRSGGIAYCPEIAYYYYISRTQTGLLGITQPPQPPPQSTPGVYTDPVRLPTNPRPGTYSVYVLGQSSPSTISSATASFTVQTTNGIPPQASFAYWPPNPSINHPVSFDASSSTPEGYNDMITRYEWDFGDGTSHYITTGNPADPTASHVFTNATTYIVTLNVTNNEGLWCTTSKPVTVSLGYGPTANFTYSPTYVIINQTETFDASNSTPGDYSTLTNYIWNFSDGTGIFNITTSQTTHSFAQPGNYTVTLTVVDSVSRNASTSAIIQVINATNGIYDVYPDGKIDGKDITLTALAFGSVPASPNWNPNADVNHDNKIDGKDITLISLHFGELVH